MDGRFKERTLPIRWFNLITYPYHPTESRRMTYEEFILAYPEKAEWATKLEEENKCPSTT